MFLLSRRQARAALAGAAASAAYLAAAEIGARKLKLSGLFVLSSLAIAGLITSGSSAKAYAAHARLDQWFNNGGTVGGPVTVNGTHTVMGDIQLHGTHRMNGNNIDNVSEINLGGQAAGVHGNFFTNGNNIYLGGGSGHAQGGSWGA